MTGAGLTAANPSAVPSICATPGPRDEHVCVSEWTSEQRNDGNGLLRGGRAAPLLPRPRTRGAAKPAATPPPFLPSSCVLYPALPSFTLRSPLPLHVPSRPHGTASLRVGWGAVYSSSCPRGAGEPRGDGHPVPSVIPAATWQGPAWARLSFLFPRAPMTRVSGLV